MKLKNTSTFPDGFIRRVMRHAVRCWGIRLKDLKEARVRGSVNYRQFSGRAYLWDRRFVITCGENLHAKEVAHLIIHEIGHLAVYLKELEGGLKTRRNGKGSGGSEEHIEHYTHIYLKEAGSGAFDYWLKEERELEAKRKETAENKPAKKTAQQKRALQVMMGLERWELKLAKAKLAQRTAEKKLRELRKKRAYYQKSGVLS